MLTIRDKDGDKLFLTPWHSPTGIKFGINAGPGREVFLDYPAVCELRDRLSKWIGDAIRKEPQKAVTFEGGL